jgi:hypothetical protein
MTCGLCGKEIKDTDYIQYYNGRTNKLVLLAHVECYKNRKNDATVKKILGSV